MAHEPLLAAIHSIRTGGAWIEKYSVWKLYLITWYDNIVEIIAQFRATSVTIFNMHWISANTHGMLPIQQRQVGIQEIIGQI